LKWIGEYVILSFEIEKPYTVHRESAGRIAGVGVRPAQHDPISGFQIGECVGLRILPVSDSRSSPPLSPDETIFPAVDRSLCIAGVTSFPLKYQQELQHALMKHDDRYIQFTRVWATMPSHHAFVMVSAATVAIRNSHP